MTSGLVIETNDLVKRFGDRAAIAGVDLSVPEACAFGFLGPNGAGKTTLIRMLLGLTRANAGEMRLLGLPVPEQRAEALARVGEVCIRYEDEVVGLSIVDDGAGPRSPADPGGHGLVGMRERVALYGGTLSLGPRSGRGFAVEARLPSDSSHA